VGFPAYAWLEGGGVSGLLAGGSCQADGAADYLCRVRDDGPALPSPRARPLPARPAICCDCAGVPQLLHASWDSSAKVHAIRKVLSAALTRAMREELVQRNVARLATLPPERPARQKPWSADEARRLLDAALRDPMYPAFVLLLVYGLRAGRYWG
jgi:integrase